MHHIGKCQVRAFRVVTSTFVTHKCVLSGICLHAIFHSCLLKRSADFLATFPWNMRIRLAKDHQQFALDLTCTLQRSCVGVFSQFAIMDAGAIEAHGSSYIRLKRRAKSKMSTDTKSSSS